MPDETLKIELLPPPSKMTWGTGRIVVPEEKKLALSGFEDEPDFRKIIHDWAGRKNYSIDSEGLISIRIERNSGQKFTYIENQRTYSREMYQLDVEPAGKAFQVSITVAGSRGLFNALSTLGQFLSAKTFSSCRISDYPAFPIRAVIEGYYGPPWSQDARLSMFSLLSDYKFNAYFYSPKDDVYHREKWRDLYPSESLHALKEMLKETGNLGLDFWYSLGPGLSMKYSSEKDLEDLVRKYEQIYAIGIRRFGLLFDDIPEELQHSADRQVFVDLPSAHVSVANKVYSSLLEKDRTIEFVVCPTQYWGRGTEYYISKMGAGLDPRIELFWTGPEICSRELTLADASVFARQTHRPVLYWDNYPVNDLEMANEMHIGPYIERDRHLYRASTGVAANAMEYAECSKIPLITIAAYLWNPENYNPESAWRHALKEVAGDNDFESFYVFADNSRYSCLYPTDSPNLKKALSQFEFEFKHGDREKAYRNMEEAITYFKKAVELFNRGMRNEKLASEIKPWSSKYAKGIELLESALSCLREKDNQKFTQLKEDFELYQSDSTYIFSDVLYPWIDALIKEGGTDPQKGSAYSDGNS